MHKPKIYNLKKLIFNAIILQWCPLSCPQINNVLESGDWYFDYLCVNIESDIESKHKCLKQVTFKRQGFSIFLVLITLLSVQIYVVWWSFVDPYLFIKNKRLYIISLDGFCALEKNAMQIAMAVWRDSNLKKVHETIFTICRGLLHPTRSLSWIVCRGQ
jgi:hypothetical protein